MLEEKANRRPSTTEQQILNDIKDTVFEMAKVDPIHAVAKGLLFNVWKDFSLDASGGASPEIYLRIAVGNETYRTSITNLITDGTDISIDLIRAASFDGGTNQLDCFNLNDLSNREPLSKIYDGVTNVSGGTVIRHLRLFGQEQAGNRTTLSIGNDVFIERILRSNTDYLIKITNNGSSSVNGSVNFYWRENQV